MSSMRAYLYLTRIEDVENDVLLPPMKHDIIYMDLDSYALKSYNAMQASLAINAIDSEREGAVSRHASMLCSSSLTPTQDYLFHSSVRSLPREAILHSHASEPESQGITDGHKQFITVSHWAKFHPTSPSF